MISDNELWYNPQTDQNGKIQCRACKVKQTPYKPKCEHMKSRGCSARVAGCLDAAEMASRGYVIDIPNYETEKEKNEWREGSKDFFEHLKTPQGIIKINGGIYPFISKGFNGENRLKVANGL